MLQYFCYCTVFFWCLLPKGAGLHVFISSCSVNLFSVDGDDYGKSCNDKDAKERGGLFEGIYPVFAFQAAYSSLLLHKSHLKISKSCADRILMFISKSFFFSGQICFILSD